MKAQPRHSGPDVSAVPAGLRHSSLRSAFTLIELMIVIVVIGMLIGLLLPALRGVTTNVHIARVNTEMDSISSGLADFKATFGTYPPSRIVLSEQGGNWTNNSRAAIRRLWPQFNFGLDRDFNGDGDSSDTITLTGDMALVFFLGGVERTAGSKDLIGFAKNPANPFSTSGNNRLGPFFEFQPDRLIQLPLAGGNMLTYVDPLPGQQTGSPYIYLSAYDGSGYNTLDIPTGSGMTNFYRQGSSSTASGWNSKSFQLISPGSDGLYGLGGHYDPENTDSGTSALTGSRAAEADNITNFHSGQLSNN